MSLPDWGSILRGHTFHGYELGDVLGSGCFCPVFEAKCRSSGVVHAIKVLPPSNLPQPAKEFHQEGALLSRLTNLSHVVDLVSSGEFTFQLQGPSSPVDLLFSYHVMELADGCLEQIVLHRENISWPERVALWRGVVRGVHQMHLNNIVHRDIKSANCLLFIRRGRLSQTVCKVADLGRSRDLTSLPIHSRQQYVVGLGDLGFAPPEFLYLQGRDSAEAHKQADLYGLGSLLFELATGLPVTAVALGHGSDVIDHVLNAGSRYVGFDLSGLRSSYEPAYDLFESAVPSVIGDKGSKLLRQLCDPVPDARQRRASQITKTSSKEKGLEWLLRRADILYRSILQVDKASTNSRRRGA